MKKLISLLITIFAVSSAAHAKVQTCHPTGESNWREASIEMLQNGASALEHIRASGIFLVADMLCSVDTCVGFVNGIKAEGTSERNSGGIDKFVIHGEGVLPTTEFICD